jgi:predicted XRE-type DNA-binding protein
MARVAESKRTTREVDKNAEEEEVKFTRSSGNVFADLGLENPEDLLQKSYFVSIIGTVIKKRRLTQVRAAEIMNIAQPDLSKLLRGRTTGFSLDRLLVMLVSLGVSPHIRFEIPTKFGRPGRVVMEDPSSKGNRELQLA